jgi:hypothetical protein
MFERQHAVEGVQSCQTDEIMAAAPHATAQNRLYTKSADLQEASWRDDCMRLNLWQRALRDTPASAVGEDQWCSCKNHSCCTRTVSLHVRS